MSRTTQEPQKFGRQRDGSYLPSPAEIRRKCEAIRAKWPPREFYMRAKYLHSGPVIAVKSVDGSEIAAAMVP